MYEALQYFNFSQMSTSEVADTLNQYQLKLSVEEALFIQNTLLKRPPSYAECVLWSIQGSEHCSYKSTKKYLSQFVTTGPNVILGPCEDAGIVAVATDNQGMRYGVVISHESHNHPSQLVPYEGAATGVGGNVRDVCCMGAEVIAIANSLRFGDLNLWKTKWIHEGVVKGIGGYANPLGVPTIAGDVYYDEGYNDNCLVTVVTLGLVREDEIIHSITPAAASKENYQFILVGKPTDNSGFGGAAFASSTLEDAKQEENKGAVQEPNAFLQRHLLKANYALFKILKEKNLFDKVGFKDLGAGGIACASVELADASGFGAEIDIELVPTSMPNLSPAVVLCSETQERFMWVVPESLVELILEHYNQNFSLPKICEGAQATVIGKIRTDKLYVVKHYGSEIVAALASDITRGIHYDRPYLEKNLNNKEPDLKITEPFSKILERLLAHENIASRAPIYETFDKQVQGRTIIEPGWADAGLLAAFNDDKYPEEIRFCGLALTVDHIPRYSKISAYWAAVKAVTEAISNIIAVGAWPLAITDCLCFGNPEQADQMAAFVDSVRGIRDACASIKDENNSSLPVVSGNVSLYNESVKTNIPPSPIISCLGQISDYRKAITYDLKQVGSILLMIGARKDECGGSVFYQLYSELGEKVPKPDLTHFAFMIKAVHAIIQAGLVLAAHDISDGGVAVALAEMSFKSNIGFSVKLSGNLSAEKKLFTETAGFILEIAAESVQEVESLLTAFSVEYELIGNTIAQERLIFNPYIDLDLKTAKQAWENGLRTRLN